LVAGRTLFGCNKKVPECYSLGAIINPAVESVNKASSGKSDKGADMAKSLNDVAATLNGTATSLGKGGRICPLIRHDVTGYDLLRSKGCRTTPSAPLLDFYR
jgi:hypothetical protein